jgi:hypothetical protein
MEPNNSSLSSTEWLTTLDFSADEKRWYEALQRAYELVGGVKEKELFAKQLALFVDHPSTITDQHVWNVLNAEGISASYKTLPPEGSTKSNSIVKKIMELLKDPENKIVVFTKYKAFLTILINQLVNNGVKLESIFDYSNIPISLRESYIKNFAEGSNAKILFSILPSIRTNEALKDFSCANKLIVCEPTWTIAEFETAVGLVCNSLQKRKV